jgi:HEPN domain-containing protein
MNRLELRGLANVRIRDAETLLAAKRWSGAYYLGGYAVECALKACIAKLTKPDEFPDRTFAEKCWTHDIERLVILAGLKDERDRDAKANDSLAFNCTTVKDWNESSRYARPGRAAARELLSAITDPRHGVLPWIKKRW